VEGLTFEIDMLSRFELSVSGECGSMASRKEQQTKLHEEHLEPAEVQLRHHILSVQQSDIDIPH